MRCERYGWSVDKRKEKESKGANDGTTERLIQERRDSGAGSGAADDSDRSERFDHIILLLERSCRLQVAGTSS